MAGFAGWFRALRQVDWHGPSLAIDPAAGDARGLINVCNYLFAKLGQITREHFGARALPRLEAAINKELPAKDFSFDEPHFPNETEPTQIGWLYRDMLRRIQETLTRDYSRQFAVTACDTVLKQVRWQAKQLLDRYVLPGTTWHKRFRKESTMDMDTRRVLLDGISIFQDLSTEQNDLLLRYLVLESFEPGELLCRQGEPADASYIIVTGEVQIEEQDVSGETRILAIMREGDFFGEAALLHNVPRAASVRATSSVAVLTLYKHDFDSFDHRYPKLVSAIKDRLQTFHMLLQIPLFSDLPANLLRAILPQLSTRNCAAGEMIINQGDSGSEFYLIKSGNVSVLKARKKPPEVINQLGPRDYFGEIALLASVPRTASVRSDTATELVVVTADDFRRLLAGSPLFAANLQAVGDSRLQT